MIAYAYLLAVASTANLQIQIDQVIEQHPNAAGTSIGVCVLDSEGKPLVDVDSDRRLVPASNQKIIATLYAVHKLGMTYQPVTKIWDEEDRVVVDAPGDPSLTLADFQSIAYRLRDKNRPVYVRQAFAPGIPDTWEWDDLPNRYAAPVYAFSFDQGAFAVRARDGMLMAFPPEFGLRLSHKGGKGSPSVTYRYPGNDVIVRGAMPKEDTVIERFAFARPDLVAARFFGTSLNETQVLPDTTPTFTLTGLPMRTLIAKCLQPSDNNYAEQLLLMAESGPNNASTTYPAARKGATDFLTQTVGIAPIDLQITDGSGLSRHNYVTSRAVAQMLHYAMKQPWHDAYLSALASPGVGTLKSRLSGSGFRGKTGTLSGVVGLSGVIGAGRDRRYVSIIINNFSSGSGPMRDLADQIVRIVEQSNTIGTTIEEPAYNVSPRNPNPKVQSALSQPGNGASTLYWAD